MAHKWANWLTLHPCSVSVEPHRLQSGGAKSAKWPHKWANWLILHPCSVSVEPHRLQSGGAK